MFDDRLKKLRLARGLSQAQVAEDLGLPQKTYCNYERNEREPNSTVLMKLGAYFGVTLDYLLNYHCDNENGSPTIEEERETYREFFADLTQEEKIELKRYASYLRFIRKKKQE